MKTLLGDIRIEKGWPSIAISNRKPLVLAKGPDPGLLCLARRLR